eukprot:6223301-Prymnesium_polylepis.1
MLAGAAAVAAAYVGYRLWLRASRADALDALRAAGRVLRPGDASYGEWLARLPSSIAQARQPFVIVLPHAASGVRACVAWAAANGKTITVVGGGHSGHCLWDGALAIDLRPGLGDAQLLGNGSLLEAGGGAALATIVRVAEAGGRMCCLGTAPTVGAGLLLQGGVGHLARWRGLAVDALERVTCVTADGEERTASRDCEPELFWAVCGAGPNVAVVTRVVLRTFPLAPVWCSELTWSESGSGSEAREEERAAAAEKALSLYAASASRCADVETMDAMLHWVDDASAAGGWRLCLAVSLFEWDAELRGAAGTLLSTLRAAMVGAGPELCEAAPVRCARPSELFARERYLNVNPTPGLPAPSSPTDGLHFWVRCAFLRSPLAPQAAAIICAAVREAPNRACYVNLQHAGGAAADPTSPHGAFSVRGWEWSAVVTGVHRGADAGAVREWVQATVRRLLPFSSGTYTVDLGPEDRELAAHAFSEASAARLRSLKRSYDPSRLFAHGLPLD